jgi:hypothetical protein
MTSTLEAVLKRVAAEETAALEEFYQLFFEATFSVPLRKQALPLSHAPIYPRDTIDILGIQEPERVVVPFFSNETLAAEWFGGPLICRAVPARQLLELVPEEWWLTLNPGSEEGKDFSPWEIALLRKGPVALPEIIADQAAQAEHAPLAVTSIGADEYVALRERLSAFALAEPLIRRLFLVREDTLARDGLAPLVLGIEATDIKSAEIPTLTERVRSEATLALIGQASIKITCGTDCESLNLGIFRGTLPFYVRKEGLLGKIKALFTS